MIISGQAAHPPRPRWVVRHTRTKVYPILDGRGVRLVGNEVRGRADRVACIVLTALDVQGRERAGGAYADRPDTDQTLGVVKGRRGHSLLRARKLFGLEGGDAGFEICVFR